MNVTLISHTPEPEKLIAAAARLCYSDAGASDIMNNFTNEKAADFVDMLASMGHESPMEHVSFTFAIEGISRACSHQLIRHRIASYSQKSQRYVNENGFEYILPPEIAAVPEAKAEFEKQMNAVTESYEKIAEILTESHKKSFIAQGLFEKEAASKARKKAYEDARFVLPNACETKIVVTMNARSLFNFFKHRCCNRAQWEIRELAIEMYRLCYAAAPNIFKNAGPSCCFGKCTEGKMSCGKPDEVRRFFKNLRGE
ncbi:MAG: FAD-dependent thymidylate synthase [Ruminococcus sp.]|nr:FAD-dependent thymidylate synthase [Ruminococcus sp.]